MEIFLSALEQDTEESDIFCFNSLSSHLHTKVTNKFFFFFNHINCQYAKACVVTKLVNNALTGTYHLVSFHHKALVDPQWILTHFCLPSKPYNTIQWDGFHFHLSLHFVNKLAQVAFCKAKLEWLLHSWNSLLFSFIFANNTLDLWDNTACDFLFMLEVSPKIPFETTSPRCEI